MNAPAEQLLEDVPDWAWIAIVTGLFVIGEGPLKEGAWLLSLAIAVALSSPVSGRENQGG